MGPMEMGPGGMDPQTLLMQGVGGAGGPMAGPGPQIPQQIMPPAGGAGMGAAMQDPRIAALVRALMGGQGGGALSGAMPGGMR